MENAPARKSVRSARGDWRRPRANRGQPAGDGRVFGRVENLRSGDLGGRARDRVERQRVVLAELRRLSGNRGAARARILSSTGERDRRAGGSGVEGTQSQVQKRLGQDDRGG